MPKMTERDNERIIIFRDNDPIDAILKLNRAENVIVKNDDGD
jgi:hypothetical protein